MRLPAATKAAIRVCFVGDQMDGNEYYERDKEGRFVGVQQKHKGKSPPWLVPYQWKKGQSGNPSGKRPPSTSWSLTKRLRKMLDAPCKAMPGLAKEARSMGFDPEATDIASVLVAKIIRAIVEDPQGTAPLARHVFDRRDGKVPDVVAQVRGAFNDLSDSELHNILKASKDDDDVDADDNQ